MSIYSGFATRFQQQAYDHCIDSLLYVLQKRILKFYQRQQADEQKFVNIVVKLHQQMRNMQKSKYLQPKSSSSVNELVKYLQEFQDNLHINLVINNQKEYVSEQLPQFELKPTLPNLNRERKKSSQLIQRQIQVESQRTKTLQSQLGKNIDEINKHLNQVKGSEQNMEFKRTVYKPPNIKSFNTKGTSRTNISKSRQQKYGNLEQRQRTSKAVSNYILEKPPIQSKVAYLGNNTPSETNYNVHKRKNKSISKASNQGEPQIGHQNEVADIIKDYIIKAKKNSKKGDRQSMSKMHDF